MADNGPTQGQIEARRKARQHGARELMASSEGFKDYDEKVLAIAAFQAHPSWQEADGETMIACGLVLRKVAEKTWQELDAPALSVNGRIFLKVSKGGPNTITGIVRWFQKNHAEEAEIVLQKAETHA